MTPYDHPHYYHLQQEAHRRVRHRHPRPERENRRGSFAAVLNRLKDVGCPFVLVRSALRARSSEAG